MHVQTNIALVVGDAGENVSMSGREGSNLVLLTKNEKERKEIKIEAYLDSGAGENMFKSTDIFVEIGEKESMLITACTDNKTKAVQGKIKSLKYDNTDIDANVDTKNKGIFVVN